MGAAFQIVAFAVSAFVAVAGALGMTTTMSMFRSGIFLMASFIGVAGLFILLSADLIGLLQIMMYIGGMLVMILFMVLFMHDPGGSMMAGMEGLALPERWFSAGLMPRHAHGGHDHGGDDHARQGSKEVGEGHGGHEHHGMTAGGMEDMSMVTPIRSAAAWLALAISVLLIAMLLLRPAWHFAQGVPDPDSARRVGMLLMEKYMVGFEGAGMLILIGIFGAVFLARPSRHPDDASRSARVALDEPPPPIIDEGLPPLRSGADREGAAS